MLAEDARHKSRMAPIERDERVEERIVGLVRQLAGKALSVADAHRPSGVRGLHERVAKGGLSRTVFA